MTITPETPFARNLRNELGEQWVQLYQGRLTAEHLITSVGPHGAPDMSAFEPDRVAEELLRCYRTILEKRSRTYALIKGCQRALSCVFQTTTFCVQL